MRELARQVRNRPGHDDRHRPGRQGRSAAKLLRVLADATGFRVRVLSAGEEGRYAYRGAVSAARRVLPESVGVVDVGGGSTEIAVGKPGPMRCGSARSTSARFASRAPSFRPTHPAGESSSAPGRSCGPSWAGSSHRRPSSGSWPGAARGRSRRSSAGYSPPRTWKRRSVSSPSGPRYRTCA